MPCSRIGIVGRRGAAEPATRCGSTQATQNMQPREKERGPTASTSTSASAAAGLLKLLEVFLGRDGIEVLHQQAVVDDDILRSPLASAGVAAGVGLVPCRWRLSKTPRRLREYPAQNTNADIRRLPPDAMRIRARAAHVLESGGALRRCSD